jgi:hypothetical protein
VEKRVMDFARYANYIRLMLERDSASSALTVAVASKDDDRIAAAVAERDAAALRLQKYMWNIYDSSMIHAFRLSQITKSPEEIRARYQQENPNAPGWKEITPLSDADISKMLDEELPKYPPPGFETRRYGGEWTAVPAEAVGVNADRVVDSNLEKYLAPPDGFSRAIWTDGDPGQPGTFDLFAPPGTSRVRLKAVLRDDGKVTLRTLDGQIVQEQTLHRTAPAEQSYQVIDLDLAIPWPGQYQIVQEGGMALRFPHDVPILLPTPFTNTQYLWGQLPHLYFYVPKGLKRVAFDVPYEQKPTFYNPDGELVEPVSKDAGKLLLVDVPAGQDGKVWSVKDLVSPKGIQITPLNVPRVFSFFPDTLYVPADALKPVS